MHGEMDSVIEAFDKFIYPSGEEHFDLMKDGWNALKNQKRIERKLDAILLHLGIEIEDE